MLTCFFSKGHITGQAQISRVRRCGRGVHGRFSQFMAYYPLANFLLNIGIATVQVFILVTENLQ
jgi:hypothetical protein